MTNPNPEHGIDPQRLKYLVFAGNFREYRQWALTTGNLSGRALYVAHPENLMGLNAETNPDLKLVRIGTFHLRSDAQEILDIVRSRFTVDRWVEDISTS